MCSWTFIFYFVGFNCIVYGNCSKPASVKEIQSILANSTALHATYSTYTSKFGKEHSQARLATFKANLHRIAAHNAQAEAGKKSYSLGINKFTDMTHEEVVQKYTGYKSSKAPRKTVTGSNPQTPPQVTWSTPPRSLDWRKYNVVSPVKNQEQCGSCVLFSATGCHEALHAMWHNGEILSLSEQELIDCDEVGGNNGCNGDTFVPTFDYLVQTGQALESAYPYTATDMNDGWDVNNCSAGGLPHPSQLTGWWHVSPADNENVLKKATAMYGPVSVAIYADQDFAQYTSGILDTPCDGSRNHGVLVVGYGSEKGIDYWIVKNSWGPDYGEKGYVRMRRNRNNMCDIAGDAVYANA